MISACCRFFLSRIHLHLFLFLICSLVTLEAGAQLVELKGRIIDFDTRQGIGGVSIQIPSIKKGTVTNEKGYFRFSVEPDNYYLNISHTGYSSLTRLIYTLDQDTLLIELKKKPPTELPEVIVESKKKDANVSDPRMSVVDVNLNQLRKAPQVFGEGDIFKALLLQTGISNAGEGASGFNVRGGNADQNLILLDGAPIFNSSHLLGFYSAISPDAIQNFTLYKGAIPASFGGRLSSLAAINIKPGNDSRLRYSTGAGPISAHAFIDGPIKKNTLTFTAGGRIAYPRAMMNFFPGTVGASNAFFYDGIAKLNYKINNKNRVTLSLYRSYDTYRFPGDTSYSWQTTLATLNWRSELSKKLVFNLNANTSKYISDINGKQPNYGFRLRNSIDQKEARGGFTWQATEKESIEIGGGFIHYLNDPGHIGPTNANSQINPIAMETEAGNEMAGYLSSHTDITSLITFEAGIRYSQFQYRGAHTIYHYAPGVPQTKESITDSTVYGRGQVIQSWAGWEPRLLLKIGIDDRTSVKLSFNRTRQYLQQVSNTIAITPIDYWKLADNQVKPAVADQAAIGLFRNFKDNLYEASIEGFYKKTSDLIEFKNGANLSLNPYLDADLLPAKGKAYGIEFNFKKNKGLFTGQIAYTWSRALISTLTPFPQEQVNKGAWYSSVYDRPHNLSVTGSLNIGSGWSFNSTFVYITGRPATYPDGSYIYNGTIVINYSERNADRLPDYHRLDVSFAYDSRRFPEQKKYSILNFSIYNVYARQNPYSIYFKRDTYSASAYQLSVLGTIIPSFTWDLYF